MGIQMDDQLVGNSTELSPLVERNSQLGAWHSLRQTILFAGRFGHLAISLVVIVIVAYILGRALLVGPVGNDAPLHISYATWIDKWFPSIPQWYPLHGGGISIQRAYPVLSHWMVAAIHRVSDLSILQSFRLLSFVSIVATSVGIYLFCWSVLRNQTAGLIGAVLFLLSPVAWTWIYREGYLAFTVSTAGVPIALLSFDKYLALAVQDSNTTRRRLWFLMTVIVSSLATLAHAVTGAGIAVGMILYVVFLTLALGRGRRWDMLRQGARATFVCAIVWAGLIAFWAAPIFFYGRIANREGLNIIPSHLTTRLYLGELFGTTPWESIRSFPNMSFPPVLAVLFLSGALFAGFYSRKALALTLVGVTAIGYVITPEIRAALTGIAPFSQFLSGPRSLLVLAEVILPAIAGYGMWALARTLIAPREFFGMIRGKASASHDFSVASLFYGGLASIAALVLAGGAIYLMRSSSTNDPWRINYGLERRGFDIRDIWRQGSHTEDVISQLSPDNFQPFYLEDGDSALEGAAQLAGYLPEVDLLRIDISPHLGRYAQNLVSFSTASQINTYTFNANLMHAMWGVQQNVFYSDEIGKTEYGTPETLNETAKWFGIEYSFIQTHEDSSPLYEAAGWKKIIEDGKVELWRYPDFPDLATASGRPLILVISRDDIRAYEQVFRIATQGVLPYDEYLIVQGREDVDSYSLEELQAFDVVFLHGYAYENSVRAWGVLEQYVEQGGALYVDTGWQWTVPEWEFLHAPRVLPVSTLKWTNYGLAADYVLSAPEISGEVDPTEFAPLIWENGPWGVSGANPEDVRQWGQVVLSAAGRPLVVAGEYGEGRVVWSGMNLVAHAFDQENDEEIMLLHNLVAWLTAAATSGEYSVTVTRDHPDRVEFDFYVPAGARSSLYWREAYYPAWHAYLETDDARRQELPIHRGGPGFMLMPIESVSGNVSVELVWETPLNERVAAIISLLTVVALGAFIVDGLLFGGQWFVELQSRLRGRWIKRNPKPKGSVEWLSDSTNPDEISPDQLHPDRPPATDQTHLQAGEIDIGPTLPPIQSERT